jgi:DNA-binding IclR family transcriptional regulator
VEISRKADKMNAGMPSKRARGLDRAFHILDFLLEQKCPMRPNEIAISINAPKSSVYEIINLLIENNVLERCDDEGRVFLGRRLYFWGRGYISHFDLAREARNHLLYLADKTNESSQLCMLEGRKYTVVMMHEGARHFRISSDVGELVPIPWTASGRLLLSHMTDEQILEFVPPEDFVLPDGDRLESSQFVDQVRAAAAEGFFSFDSVADNFTHCFAAPVHDEHRRCIATLCLIAPRIDATRNFESYKQELVTRAGLLTVKLSGNEFHGTEKSAAV